MGPRVDSISPVSSYDPTSSEQDSTTTVRLGESSLKDVASRLGLDPGDLELANPQIADSTKLKVGQEVHLPSGTEVSSSANDAKVGDRPNTHTAQTPTFLGDPLTDSVMKAQLASHFVPTNMDGTERMSPGVNKSVNLAGLPEFRALPAPVREKLLKDASDPMVETRLQQVLQRPLYSKLSADQRTKLLNVFAGADASGREELVQLMGRRLGNGEPALLSTDNSGSRATLLDNLDKLASGPLSPAVAGQRSQILGQVIDDAAEPTWFMDQGSVGTCAPTSFQTHLLINSPSEYVRLLTGLLGPDRKATLANGDSMIPALNDLTPNPTVAPGGGASIPDSRSLTERVFQSALAQYTYLKTQQPPFMVNASGDIPGLNLQQCAAALTGLSGQKYMVNSNGGSGAPVVVGEILNKRGPVPVALNWGNGAHMVLVDHIAKDSSGNMKVYIRNPWGSAGAQGQTYKDGQALGTAANNTNNGPARTVADRQSGLESMNMSDFVGALMGAVVPQD